MKTLVAYFSATGTTEYPANIIAELLKSDIFEIVPAELYTADDLNWNNQKSRSSVEMKEGIRPALDHNPISIAEYDLIFLGFPIWWGREPSVVDTFLDAYDFTGKNVIPFCTSGGSGIGKTCERIASIVGEGACVDKGKRFGGEVSAEDLKYWNETLGL